MKFTFKTVKEKGKWSWLSKPQHYIKLNGKKVGWIEEETWKIFLHVYKEDINEDGNPNCKWRTITLIKKSYSLKDAKDFLNNKIESICEIYKLYSLEN